ncbi:MAG: thioredoxin family protein [Elusimicrobiota bacterium]
MSCRNAGARRLPVAACLLTVTLLCCSLTAWAAPRRIKTLEQLNKIAKKVKKHKPMVVYFDGEGCPPCDRFRPVYRAVADELVGRMLFYEFEVSEDNRIMDTTLTYIPALGVFYEGKTKILIQGSDNPAFKDKESMKEFLLQW